MPDVSIRELSNLTRAVNGIADKISKDPFKSMHEDGRHQEIIGIQKTQTEILNQQKIFTKILAMATIILAIGTILQTMFYFAVNETLLGWKGMSVNLLFGLLGGLLGILAVYIYSILKKDRKT